MGQGEHTAALAQLADQLADQDDDVAAARVAVDGAVELVRDAEHASVTAGAGGRAPTLASSSDLARWADGRAVELSEGPRFDDATSWSRSGDLASDGRWPSWGPEVSARGLRSALILPMATRGRVWGSLVLYAERPGAFADADDVEVARHLASHVAAGLGAARLVANLQAALASRHDIGVAEGILMDRYGLTADRAFETLRRISQDENRRLRDVAREVVEVRGLPGSGRGQP